MGPDCISSWSLLIFLIYSVDPDQTAPLMSVRKLRIITVVPLAPLPYSWKHRDKCCHLTNHYIMIFCNVTPNSNFYSRSLTSFRATMWGWAWCCCRCVDVRAVALIRPITTVINSVASPVWQQAFTISTQRTAVTVWNIPYKLLRLEYYCAIWEYKNL